MAQLETGYIEITIKRCAVLKREEKSMGTTLDASSGFRTVYSLTLAPAQNAALCRSATDPMKERTGQHLGAVNRQLKVKTNML